MHFVARSRVSGISLIQSNIVRAHRCGRLLGNAKLAVAGALACLAFAHAATAAPLTGSMGIVPSPFVASSASFTASSLTMNAPNLITTAESGDFLTQVPAHSDLTANTTTITGLSTSPLADSIYNF